MRVRVLSDLHLEFGGFTPPEVPADVVVLAGDIVPEHYGIKWAREIFPETPVVYVAGNHEYHAADLEAVLARTREEAARWGVHYLERDEVVIEGGCGFSARRFGRISSSPCLQVFRARAWSGSRIAN